MCTQGTLVTSGRAQGIVVGTGPLTAIGQIRDAMTAGADEEVLTPLKQKLNEFGELLSKVCEPIVCGPSWCA